MPFKIKLRRRFFWRTFTVVGTGFNASMDRLTLYFLDGSQREIHKWSECDAILGADWVLATKKEMEKATGADIKLSV